MVPRWLAPLVALAGCSWTQPNPAFVGIDAGSTSSSGSSCPADGDEPNDMLADAVAVPPAVPGTPTASVASALDGDDLDWFVYDTELAVDARQRFSAATSLPLCTCLVPRCVDGLIADLQGCRRDESGEGYEDEIDGFVACCGQGQQLVPNIGIECTDGDRIQIHMVVVGAASAVTLCGESYVAGDACTPYELGYDVVEM